MSIRTWVMMGATALLMPALSFGQQPPAGDGGAGGFGGRGGGNRGGMRMMMGDPDQAFNLISGGKDVLVRDQLNPMMQGMFDRIAQGANITGGQITREQFREAMSKFQSAMAAGGGMGIPGGGRGGRGGFGQGGFGGNGMAGFGGQGNGNTGGAGPGVGGDTQNMDMMAERMFRRMDKNGDGQLDASEMSEALAAERDRWDTNQDGFISLDEYKAYFAARVAQIRNDRDPSNNNGASDSQDEEPARKPVVYRAGKLPPELMPWFAEIDTNQDAQVSLAEWRASGKPLSIFKAMDHNGDNLVTVEEALLYMRLNKLTPATVLTSFNRGGDVAFDDEGSGDRSANYGFTAPGQFTGQSPPTAVAANDRSNKTPAADGAGGAPFTMGPGSFQGGNPFGGFGGQGMRDFGRNGAGSAQMGGGPGSRQGWQGGPGGRGNSDGGFGGGPGGGRRRGGGGNGNGGFGGFGRGGQGGNAGGFGGRGPTGGSEDPNGGNGFGGRRGSRGSGD